MLSRSSCGGVSTLHCSKLPGWLSAACKLEWSAPGNCSRVLLSAMQSAVCFYASILPSLLQDQELFSEKQTALKLLYWERIVVIKTD